MHYKCECYGRPLCNCPRKSASSTYFLKNIYDIAETLAEVMVICGIHQCKAKAAIDIVIYSFLHYDEIRYRIDAVPRKRLCKEDLVHDLGRKCLMNRMEAQLAYSIIKRAFKAFYHATGEGGIKNRALEAEAIHTSECLWVHAAKRTAQVFASYEGMFFSAQKSYEAQIRCAYKRLFDRLQSRKSPSETLTACACKTCIQRQDIKDMQFQEAPIEPTRIDSGYTSTKKDVLTPKASEALSKRCDQSLLTERQMIPSECTLPICNRGIGQQPQGPKETETAAELETELVEGTESKISLNLPRCYKCNCPKLVCDCNVDLETGIVSTECSQGPFTCRWIRVDEEKDEDRPDPCITRPLEHECPVDCEPTTSQLTCNVECECDCEDCECIEEDSSGYDDDNEAADDLLFDMEEEAIFGESDTESTKYEIPDISTLGPNLQFAGCRVQLNHVVEETSSTNNPASIAQIEVHRIEASIKSEPVLEKVKGGSVRQMNESRTKNRGSGEGVPQNKSLNVRKSLTKEEDQIKRDETEAISKILGDLL